MSAAVAKQNYKITHAHRDVTIQLWPLALIAVRA